MRRILLLLAVFLSACGQAPAPVLPEGGGNLPDDFDAAAAELSFRKVSGAVGPTAERVCRDRTRGINCNFRIAIDLDPTAPVNAFQTLDNKGNPVVLFTIAMLADVRNPNELAFVMSHEAAHHILGHLDKQANNAAAGAEFYGDREARKGGTPDDIRQAQELGAVVGSRIFSKEFELEADALGSVIAMEAGYDPLQGAQFFFRLPDPGDKFLGSHPPNAERLEIVRLAVRNPELLQ
ncbi:M48 family metallopeptidase [Falsiruegeria mediterranea]|jgi:predicted Zn-dependent protease|uniref:Beta-barrel assembly-enhancing protease n=1 Tax=Falsiruegeria mediterranea M17 TaxID=1200281 RepID=A0A2R8C7R1_9RHOB|nr:M48 family metallopeptidase [Falsiruegeria mediterranea]SPJ28396.1 Beta-barrel assembly-enhancing protease [Falsiruegeria mediterranea M17]